MPGRYGQMLGPLLGCLAESQRIPMISRFPPLPCLADRNLIAPYHGALTVNWRNLRCWWMLHVVPVSLRSRDVVYGEHKGLVGRSTENILENRIGRSVWEYLTQVNPVTWTITMESLTIQLMPVKMLSSRIAFATARMGAFESLVDIIPFEHRITLRFA